VAAYVVMVLLWGSTWAAIKIGVAEVPPYLFAFERAIAVSTILTLTVLGLRQSFPRTRTALLASAVAGLFNIGTSWALIFWAEQFVPSGLVAVFGAMAPVWTAILAHFFVQGDRLSRLKIVALVLGLVGTALLVGAPAPSEGPNALLATALLALMPISWAIAAILMARYLSRESPIAVVGIGTWTGAAFLLPFALTQAGQPQHWTTSAVLAFAYLVLGGSCVGLVLNAWLFRKLRPTTVTLSQVLIPTQALLIGGFALGEEFTLRMLAGAALVVSAVALNARAGSTARTGAAEPIATAAD
ncbi:MAG TPA: EamA family transporter, partial [Candidatus Limnocylindria bacterium]|nr:EamA family transporter [Candidatus Limnocylindria bacterium]